MPTGKNRLWTTGRKLPGNILPILIGAPFLVYGVKEFPSKGLSTDVRMALIAFPLMTWVSTNFLGLIGNIGLKAETGKRLHQERPFDKSEKTFVGFARPGYNSLLDPHEDVGYLIVHTDHLEFWGSDIKVDLQKASVKSISFRPNPHSVVGLGRWVCVEGESAGKAVRLLVEPRERATLLGNLIVGTKLKKRLEGWHKSP
jgi:hypothetical protein